MIEAQQAKLEEALKLLEQALLINPEFALARKNLGDVYLALAMEAYEKAAAKLPRNTVLQQRLRTLQRITSNE